jgi:hypothetical protein
MHDEDIGKQHDGWYHYSNLLEHISAKTFVGEGLRPARLIRKRHKDWNMSGFRTTCWNEVVNEMAEEVKINSIERKERDIYFSNAIDERFQQFMDQAKSDPKQGFEVLTHPLKRKAEYKHKNRSSKASSSGGVPAAADQRETYPRRRQQQQNDSWTSTGSTDGNWQDRDYQKWSSYNWWKHRRW